MNESKIPWQTPEILCLSVSDTRGANLTNSDDAMNSNTAYPCCSS